MGTRGLYGFRYKKKYYMNYNHFDSYRSALGNVVIDDLKKLLEIHGLDGLRKLVEGMIEYNSSMEPTNDAIKKLEPYTDLTVSNRSTSDWYCLTKGTQYSLIKFLESNYHEGKLSNSTTNFIEYVYIIDLDDCQLCIKSHDDENGTSYGFDKLDELKH